MSDLISRKDAVNEIHKYFVEEIDKTPVAKDEDGDEVYTDMPTVNTLLKRNKELSKRIKALPSAEPNLMEDGTLEVNVHDARLVKRVLIGDEKNWGGLYYPDAEPETEMVLCALADRTCPFQGEELAWCLTCPHISEEDRNLVKKAVSEPKTGEWMLLEYEFLTCSECGDDHWTGCESIEEAKERLKSGDYPNYCSNCGAKMNSSFYRGHTSRV